MRWSQSWPIVLRRTGPEQLHLVHGAGGPLGGDDFALELELAPGGVLGVGSAGATVVQPGGAGHTPASWRVGAELGAGAHLQWTPEPSIVCDAAELETELRVRLDRDAGAVLREIVVLGRHGERGGGYRGRLVVDVDGQRLLAHRTVLDGADPVLSGPAVTGGARAVGTLVLAGAVAAARVTDSGDEPGLRWAWTELAGPGRVLLAVGEPRAVVELLTAVTPARR
jgi:urease accessory protein